jgi:hypothetical protein
VAEGLDQAADAFRNEIAPASGRPRDDGGRFASTSRPEPMFEPRPVEGDEKTGDVRDGGEDARLAARERRVADGWTDERQGARQTAAETEGKSGERSVERRGQERSDAAADFGHLGDLAEQERRGPEGELDQDAQGPDGKPKPAGDEGDAEGASEQDAEAENWQISLNGQPVEQLEVTVDGKPTAVSLDECVKGYIREATFHQRMSKVAEARQAVEAEANGVVQSRQAYAQKLEYLQRVLNTLTPPQPDWDKEFAVDPRGAHEKQKAYAQIYGQIQWAADEMAREQTQHSQEYDQKAQKYAIDQFTQFVVDANIRDEQALQSEMSLMRSYGKLRGFQEGELATVYDKRMLLVLRDAALYHQSTKDKPKPVVPGKGRSLAPGVATPIGNATRRSLDEAMNKLAKTGRTDDAALVFQRLIR